MCCIQCEAFDDSAKFRLEQDIQDKAGKKAMELHLNKNHLNRSISRITINIMMGFIPYTSTKCFVGHD